MHQTASPTRRCLSRARIAAQWTAHKLSFVLSMMYATLIGLLIPIVGYLYFYWLRPRLAHYVTPSVLAAHTAASVLLLLSAVINYAGALFVRPGSPSRADDPEGHPPPNDTEIRTNSQQWRWCKICSAPKPPRSHHCRQCARCYHRHCHHCPAIGRCIGQENYAYYWRFIAGAFVGALTLAGTAGFVLRRSARSITRMDADMLLFTIAISGAVAVAVVTLLAWHCYLLCTGQTTIECYENWAVRRSGNAPSTWTKWGGPFDRGLRLNVRDAFGDPPMRALPWWSVLILPLPRKFLDSSLAYC